MSIRRVEPLRSVFRLRIRTLMVVSVLVAVMLSLVVMQRNRGEYLYRRDSFARAERRWATSAEQFSALVVATRSIREIDAVLSQDDAARGQVGTSEASSSIAEEASYQRNVKLAQDLVKYCSAMKQKYEHAAAHPWIIVPPDPPEPPSPD